MIPRQRLDLGWNDILSGLVYCLTPSNREAAHDRVADYWSSAEDTVVSISERSSFDLVLEALNLPAGSEILITSMNIKPMFEAIKRHNLVAVPVDVDMATLAANPEQLEDRLSGNTRAILVAQLFGSRHEVDNIVEFARKHDLFFFEDCAQAFTGDGYTGHPDADAVMFSFGPIKTCSTIMGGITRFKDTAIAAEVKRLQSQWPVHNRFGYMRLLMRFALLITLSKRWLFTPIMGLLGWMGVHPSEVNGTVRVFGGKDEVKKSRQQPSDAMYRLLLKRLKNFDTATIDRRKQVAQTVAQRLPASVFLPAQDAPVHSYWIFPARVANPIALMKHLHKNGFDSINKYSSFIIPEGAAGEEDPCRESRSCMAKVLYLPVHTGVSQRDLIRLADCITEFETQAQTKRETKAARSTRNQAAPVAETA